MKKKKGKNLTQNKKTKSGKKCQNAHQRNMKRKMGGNNCQKSTSKGQTGWMKTNERKTERKDET
jgi:hypothetical protein